MLIHYLFDQRHEHILLPLHEDVFRKMVTQTFFPNAAPRQPSLEGSPVRLNHLRVAPCHRINKVLWMIDGKVGVAELHQSIVGPPAVGVDGGARLNMLNNQT